MPLFGAMDFQLDHHFITQNIREVLPEELIKSSNVTLAEARIGFCILFCKICVKLSGIY